jgi:hypothetical protein
MLYQPGSREESWAPNGEGQSQRVIEWTLPLRKIVGFQAPEPGETYTRGKSAGFVSRSHEIHGASRSGYCNRAAFILGANPLALRIGSRCNGSTDIRIRLKAFATAFDQATGEIADTARTAL